MACPYPKADLCHEDTKIQILWIKLATDESKPSRLDPIADEMKEFAETLYKVALE